MHPVSFCTSLMQVGAFILVMAKIFLGLASMPRWLMMKPSSFPDGTPKTLVRVELPAVLSQGCESLFKIGDERVRVSGLDNHIIHVSLDVLVELSLETDLDSSLVGSAGVLQPERHGCVAVGTERGDERGLLLVFFLDSNLVVPGVAVEEAEQVAARHGVYDLIYPRQPKGVLGEVFVEVGVVDAHPPLVGVLLADEDGFGEPLRMEDFSDEASRE
jgi:hypothetical protein